MTRTLWMMAMLFGVVLPAFTLMSGGELFPAAPASVSFNPPPNTTRVQHIDDARLTELADEMGLVPAPVIVIHTESSSWVQSPAGSCAGEGPECEGEAQIPLPGQEWTEYVSLERLRQDFEDACRAETVDRYVLVRVIELERDEIRSRRPHSCVRGEAGAEDYTAFCERWRC